LQEHSRELLKLERHLEVRSAQLGSQELRTEKPESQESGSEALGSQALRSQPLGQDIGAQDQSLSPRQSPDQYSHREPLFLRDEASSLNSGRSKTESVQARTERTPGGRVSTGPGSAANYTATLAQVVQTQHQIRARHLELENSMSLVAERVTEIAKAGGAAIGFLDDTKTKVRYRGVAGQMTLPAGTEVALDKALCAASLRTGQIIRCADVNPEFLFDPEECRRRGIQALIAVPIFHEGGIAGGLELYYSTTRAFTEEDVHTCQLMAGLITEALAREDELGWKKSLASERADMLEALEQLKPKAAASTETPAAKGATARGTASRMSGTATVSPATTFACRKCGHQLVGQEQFCGKCGTRRGADGSSDRDSGYEPPSMQSKLASLKEVQEALTKSAVSPPVNGDLGHNPGQELEHVAPALSDPARPEKPLADSIEEEMPELFAAPELRAGKMSSLSELPQPGTGETTEHSEPTDHLDFALPQLVGPEEHGSSFEEKEMPPETTLAEPAPSANWSSAFTARQFLEQLAGTDQPGTLARFWRARRGDIYLGIAVILVAAAIRWGIWSNHSVSATGKPTPAAAGHRNPPPEPEVSLFDRMLISLGMADPPPAPEYKGNPETQVWVDLHTALYYCPGTDFYGKTPKGKFTSQRDAQLDQFEPAYRKACD